MTYIPPIQHIISPDETGNSTKTLLAGSGSFTGAWEDVTQYATVAVAIIGTNVTSGTLYIESSQDGGVLVNTVGYIVKDATFDLPKVWNVVESHIRIRYVNDGVAQTGKFQIQTKYSNGQELGVLHTMGESINNELTGNLVKSVITGQTPSGEYVNAPHTGHDSTNSTITPLGISTTYTGSWADVSRYHGVTTSVTGTVSGQAGTLFMEFSHDGASMADGLGTSAYVDNLTNSTPRTVGVVAKFFRVRYENNGVAQTTFSLQTILQTERIDLTATTNQPLDDNEDVRLVRSVSSPNVDRNSGLLIHQQSKRKFGKNESVSTAFETLWSHTVDWIPAEVAETIRIKVGGNVADDTAGAGARTVVVTFLNSNWDEVTETLVTAGASASAPTSVTGYRVLTAKVVNVGTYHGSNTGAIVLEQTTSGNVMAAIAAGAGTTEQSMITVEAGKTMYITDIFVSVGQANSADVILRQAANADVFSAPYTATQNEWGVEDFSGAEMFPLKTHLKFDEKTDVWFEAKKITGGGTARVAVDFSYILIDNPI